MPQQPKQPKETQKVQITAILLKETWDMLRHQALDEGRSASKILDELIAQYLKRKGKLA